jgi:NDP-sugar pyrophosphorylase family protein
MPRRVTIVVPAAGRGQRFRDAGIHTPKPLIKIEHEGLTLTMLEHAVCSASGADLRIVCRDEDEAMFRASLVRAHELVVMDVPSTGQSHSVYWGLQGVEGPVLVVNSDQGFDYPLDTFVEQVWRSTFGLLVFDSGIRDSPSPFSHVDNVPLYSLAREKYALSRWALAGAFWCSDAQLLRRCIEVQLNRRTEHGEYYLSEAMGPGLAVIMPSNQLRSWGTPEQLQAEKERG